MLVADNPLASQDAETGISNELVNDERQQPDPIKRVLVTQVLYELCAVNI